MEQSKFDAVVEKKVDNIRDRSRGFLLDLASAHDRVVLDQLELLVDSETVPDGGATEEIKALIGRLRGSVPSTTIEVRESLPPVDDWERPADVRQHTIGDTASFIDYCRRYGDPEKSLVMFNDEYATLTLDELVQRGDREQIRLDFKRSLEWSVWSNILNRSLQHREMFQLIIPLSHTLRDPTILESCRKVRISAKVDHESDLQESGKTIGFVVKTSAGEELAQFPKTIPLLVPVLDQDVTLPDQWKPAGLKLLIELPDEAGESVTFTLMCPEWANIARERIRLEGEIIRSALEGFPVIHGRHTTAVRTIGYASRPMPIRR